MAKKAMRGEVVEDEEWNLDKQPLRAAGMEQRKMDE
jgi:hypothetical protein